MSQAKNMRSPVDLYSRHGDLIEGFILSWPLSFDSPSRPAANLGGSSASGEE